MNCEHGIDIDEYDCHECQKDIADFWERDNLKTIKKIHSLTQGEFDKYTAKRTLQTIRGLIT